ARGGVRDADSVAQQLELLGWREQLVREAGRMEQPPEVVARIGEVRAGGGGDASGIDPAEDDPETGPQDIRDRRLRLLRALRAAPGHARRGTPRSGAGAPRPRRSTRAATRVARAEERERS